MLTQIQEKKSKAKLFLFTLTKPGEKPRANLKQPAESFDEFQKFVPYMYGGGWRAENVREITEENSF